MMYWHQLVWQCCAARSIAAVCRKSEVLAPVWSQALMHAALLLRLLAAVLLWRSPCGTVHAIAVVPPLLLFRPFGCRKVHLAAALCSCCYVSVLQSQAKLLASCGYWHVAGIACFPASCVCCAWSPVYNGCSHTSHLMEHATARLVCRLAA